MYCIKTLYEIVALSSLSIWLVIKTVSLNSWFQTGAAFEINVQLISVSVVRTIQRL